MSLVLVRDLNSEEMIPLEEFEEKYLQKND